MVRMAHFLLQVLLSPSCWMRDCYLPIYARYFESLAAFFYLSTSLAANVLYGWMLHKTAIYWLYIKSLKLKSLI